MINVIYSHNILPETRTSSAIERVHAKSISYELAIFFNLNLKLQSILPFPTLKYSFEFLHVSLAWILSLG